MTATESPSGHKTFHEKLDLLKQRLLDRSQLSDELLATSVQSFLRAAMRRPAPRPFSPPTPKWTTVLEVEIEQLAISLLALQQPMARRDLRFIVSAIRIAGDLERVGDHAVNIAQSALRMVELRLNGAAA